MTRPRLRHLALVVQDAAATAAFYRETLGMEQFHADPDGSRFLTDGYINLALIQQRLDSDIPAGFNHFGFEVADVEDTMDLMTARGAPRPERRSGNRPFAEYRATDPEGNWFDLSEHGFLPPERES
ncbi:VOC family protein [Streptomyces sp. VB1]|uniref:VOC family protein n=1 Tax=Streptomyces sp. VB1 TaxID=2986803 RepID=UPI0022419F29|nr:VOC family protein [Streptomyces sp. VB1]UZI32792.1 VOC family protein [Streptomyces sp. VB1]